ncbi:uncharacterized protein LOC110066596 [Orbicella faveolata]|uniref:uncharacterized protein LOC110066596 n=1 Tax=Orbicella faveolata TaxID=48498 RepID=UPI0009E4314E|nr:uncharacterized protein LOC110066596 [Orbicella faveolata]
MTSPVSSEEQQLFEKDHQLESTASKEDVAALDQKTNDLKLPLVPDEPDLVNGNQEKKVSGGGRDGMTSPVSSEEQQLFEKDHQLESTANKDNVAALDQETTAGNNLVLSL